MLWVKKGFKNAFLTKTKLTNARVLFLFRPWLGCVSVARVKCIVLKSIIGSASDAALLQLKRTIKGTSSGSGLVSGQHSHWRDLFPTITRRPKIASPPGVFGMPKPYCCNTLLIYQYIIQSSDIYITVPKTGDDPKFEKSLHVEIC